MVVRVRSWGVGWLECIDVISRDQEVAHHCGFVCMPGTVWYGVVWYAVYDMVLLHGMLAGSLAITRHHPH